MSVAIFNGPYAKILAASGIKLKDDTLILHGVGTPVVTAPNGSIFLSTTGLHVRQLGVWVKLQAPDLDINYLDIESWNSTSLSDANITNIGCTLDTTSQINGGNSLKAIHQTVSTYSLKKTISVSPKFRGRNATLSLWGKSGATLGNVTILFRDETNSADIGVSQQISLNGTISNKVFSFIIPATCSNLSYKISYLPQSGSVETFIDDISILLTEYSNFSTSISFPVSSTPTVTKLLSGTGTYTRPANVSHIKIRMVGGGGGGGGNSNNGGNLKYAGTTGGTTTFGDMSAFGGTGGGGAVAPAGLGGSASLGAVAVGSIFIGGAGQTSSGYNANGSSMGGSGGSSMLGGGAGGPNESASGIAALANTGGGGSGASGIGYTPYNYGAAGGGAGGGIDAVIINPSATYSYSIGAGGAGAGGSNYSGGAGGSGYIEITEFNNVNVTRDISLSTAQLVQEADGSMQLNGFSVALGTVGTKIFTLNNPTYQNIKANGFIYVKDSINGDYVEATSNGQFSFNFGYDSNALASTTYGIGFSKNSNQLNVQLNSINQANVLAMGYFGDVPYISWTGILEKGDKVRLHDINHGASAGTSFSSFSVSYQGSLKQLNVSSDSKIELSTHSLRLEGASTRGTTDTFIVKYDNQTLLRGDGFEVLNTVANGTVITIKKAGRLTVGAGILGAAGMQMAVSKNQQILTAFPTQAEIMQSDYCNAQVRLAISPTFDVVIGDKIRVATTLAILGQDPSNILTLHLQENSIPANFSNILPQYSEGSSSVRVNQANGLGSTGTKIRRFSNLIDNIGNSISYTDSGTEGAKFIINEGDNYQISYTDAFASASWFGISKDALSLTGNISSLNTSERLCLEYLGNGGEAGTVSWSGYLPKDSIIRPHTDGAGFSGTYAQFTISRVGRPNVTANITPFVNLKLPDTNIVGEVVAYAGSNIPDNFLDCIGQAVSRTTYSDLFNVIGVSHGSGNGVDTFNIPDYRGRFLRGIANGSTNDPDRASRTAMATGGNTGDAVGSVQLDGFKSHNHEVFVGQITGGGTGGTGRPQQSGPNSQTTFTGGNETRPVNAYVKYIIRYMPNQTGVATPTEQISSDSLSFNFKSTPIVSTDPVGTFNTYTYAANTNTATIATSSPTQTFSSMNINGIQVFARGYGSAGASTLPSRVDVFIGRNLKSTGVNAYSSIGKLNAVDYDSIIWSSNVAQAGVSVTYNETTGILSLDAGNCISAATTSRFIDSKTGSGNAYFTINASKSPSLVTIPNLAPRVAYLSDVKANTISGGSSIVGTQTRALNTLVDSTGIVTSLVANQFVLPEGTYQIEGSSPAYAVNVHRVKLRNITDSVTQLFGTSEFAYNVQNVANRSFISGEIKISSPKTFELQQYTALAIGTNGLGVDHSNGEINVYSLLKITKIK